MEFIIHIQIKQNYTMKYLKKIQLIYIKYKGTFKFNQKQKIYAFVLV